MRILIADDEAIIRLGLRRMLEDAGHQVVGAAADGVRAVELAGQTQPDLVILDIKMPALSGLDAAQQITHQRPVPILILTAFSDRALVEQARELAVLSYLVKPVRESELLAAIQIAAARFHEWQGLREEARSLEEALATREVVEKAKRLLMERCGIAEREAFRRIQMHSRSARRPMRALAEEILREPDLARWKV